MIGVAKDRADAVARRARAGLMLALQAGLAAGLAWYVAHDLIGRPAPFFAPIAAVITLASSVGQRMRRTAELVAGVAVGIGIGDGIILLIGTGPVQIGLIVLLAVLVATAAGGGPPLIVQSASSAVLVATLTVQTGHPWTRFFDALVGGGVGLVVMTVLLPINPLSVVRRAADPALRAFTAGLHEAALGLAEGDPDVIHAALTRLRSAEGTFEAFRTAIDAARENVAFAPARWRTRGALAQYVEGAPQLTYALRNVRVMIRRAQTALNDRERVPEVLPASVRHLGDAVDLLRQEWARGAEPVATRERALRAASESGRAYETGVGYSGGVVVAQIRTSVADLLRATGVEYAEATRQVRAAVGWRGRPHGARNRAARSRPAAPPPESDAS
ncbi:FUSC family protein [Actinoplanes ianthinogenes]|uniref:FUSC family protein n=1 Tax=Actinoplanes ianthinogenes TaxID=122358 RepID=A0ABM7LV25_9ACTN|nr:FUSC family protein [Actinoplanes ianthinogenes]BCJ43182.1 FUSC family protein [Actinoplanes ianthinogenes]GGQ89638.1 FUSC family protein [Actinoplanes ianthinogenes]